MALYAFDGTGNEDKPEEGKDTNVLRFYQAYCKAYAAPGNCLYIEGVGTRHSLVGMVLGSALGLGGRERLREAMDKLEQNIGNGDRSVDVIGFSRGAALALEFANEIHDCQEPPIKGTEVRFLGLWDTVASFGLPGNNVNVGYTLTVPPNVLTCRHAIALDERRQTFPLTRAVQDRFSGRELRDIEEVWFRGYHSDVGGGNENVALSNIALHWMYCRAQACGIHLDPDLVAHARDGADPRGDGKTPGMDRVPDKKRTIGATDRVHDSVFRRERVGKFEGNNPPRGLLVTNDAGEVLPHGFEEGG